MQRPFSIKTSAQVVLSLPLAKPGAHPVGSSWKLPPRNAQPGPRTSEGPLLLQCHQARVRSSLFLLAPPERCREGWMDAGSPLPPLPSVWPHEL